MSFEIERNVPLPPPRSKYPFAEMQIGDSFLVPIGAGEDVGIVQNRVQISARHWSKRNGGATFATRRTSKGIRVWRIDANANTQTHNIEESENVVELSCHRQAERCAG